MHAHRRSFAPIVGVLLVALLLSNCSEGTSNADETELRKVNITMSRGEASVDISEAPSRVANDVELSAIKMLVDELQLVSVSDDTIDFPGNLVVDFPLDGDTLAIAASIIPVGSYDNMEVQIAPDAVEDTLLDDGTYSIAVQGTYNGEDFTFRTDREYEVEFPFDPPIEITDTTNTVNLNLSVNLDIWFKNADPTNPDDQELIEDNIARSLTVQCRFGSDDD